MRIFSFLNPRKIVTGVWNDHRELDGQKKMKKILILLMIMFCVHVPNIHALDNHQKQSIIDLLSKIRTSYAAINDYSAIMRLENFENDYQLQNQKMWFKKPGYLLLEQLGPFKKGAVLSMLPNGTIKGHLGGFLSFAVVSLDKDDKNMYGVTHDSAVNSDYDKILDIAMSKLERVTDYSIETVSLTNGKKSNQQSSEQIVLDTSYSDNKVDRIRLLISPSNMLIVGLERYRKGKLLHKIAWNNIKTNIGINPTQFDL